MTSYFLNFKCLQSSVVTDLIQNWKEPLNVFSHPLSQDTELKEAQKSSNLTQGSITHKGSFTRDSPAWLGPLWSQRALSSFSKRFSLNWTWLLYPSLDPGSFPPPDCILKQIKSICIIFIFITEGHPNFLPTWLLPVGPV